jgi:glucose-6-phosphate dehydrogenase assembly protein OpcA
LEADLMEGVWSARDTTPQAIEDALRELLREGHDDGQPHTPARVLNLVVIVDSRWRGETANRLEAIDRYHPSRTILCAVELGRNTIDAWATIECEVERVPARPAPCGERVEIRLGDRHLAYLDSVIGPILVKDLVTVVWAPHRHEQAVDALLGLADVVLLDSVDEASLTAGLRRANGISGRAEVVDLAWLRGLPWRERIAAMFDPPAFRSAVDQISAVSIRHRGDSGMVALMLAGWLATRLEWKPRALISHDGVWMGRLRGRRQHVQLRLEPVHELATPGLAGVTLETASGASFSLERSPGGLAASHKEPDGRESNWTVLGASRGELGIFAEGIQQALVPDRSYAPALAVAQAMLTD